MLKGNILVIDDEDTLCGLLEQFLELNGLCVTCINDSSEALKEIKMKKDYDVIIADILMPEISGLDLLRASNEQTMNYQFILITGFARLISNDVLKPLNPFSLIKKPFDLKTLITTVEDALKKRREIHRGNSGDNKSAGL